MRTSPRVSVIVAAHNSRFVGEAVGSALDQQIDLEVLVLDDGDHAITHAGLGELAHDPRVKLFANPGPLGPAKNHARGLEIAQGEFICILNHDDRLYPDALSRLLAPMHDDPRVVLSFADHDVIDIHGDVDRQLTSSVRRQFGRSALAEGPVPWDRVIYDDVTALPQAAVFRRGIVKRIPPSVGSAYDRYICIALARSRGRAIYRGEVLGSWRVHADQLTRTNQLRARGESAALSRQALLPPITSPVRALRWAIRAHASYLRGAFTWR